MAKFLNDEYPLLLRVMLKRKITLKTERKGFLGWKKDDKPELMGISEDDIKDIETILTENKSLHDIFTYVNRHLPGWSISYIHKEGKHIITIEKETLGKRIIFEVESIR
ncbi:MAG: hypothetical protein QXS93_02515 [Candidatus Micrarchaeia archaeon]